MNFHKLGPYTREINKDLFKAVKNAQNRWELEKKKQHQNKTDLENQKTLIH